MSVAKHHFSVIPVAYILSPDREKVLMLYHNTNPNDPSYGKYNGLSGAINANESLSEGIVRIIHEETGSFPKHIRYRGNIHWARFGREQESILGHIFLVEGLEGAFKPLTPRGQMHWVRIDEILNGDIPIWSGDEHFLPLVFDMDPRPFHGYMPYDHGVPYNWSFDRTEI